MIILHTMPDIDNEASGPSYSVIRLCQSLIQSGEDSTVALIGSNSKFEFLHSFNRGMGPAKLGNSPDMLNWLQNKVRKGEVDIVHNHSLWMLPNVYPGWATKGTRIPYLVSPRGTLSPWAMSSGSSIKKLFWPLVQRPSIAHASCFHATSEAEILDIRMLGFKQPIALIPNGIDLPMSNKSNIKDSSRKTLLYLGRLHPIKGLDFLLHAWSFLQLEFPNWDLRIVGPIDNINAQALINLSLNLSLKRVNFSGPAYGTDKFDAYRSSHLYVLPTHSENFAVTVAESLACGTPVVVSQGAPWHGLLENNAGWWPAIGMEPLLESLRSAMSTDDEKLLSMGINGRNWMANDFSWNRIANQMILLYKWLQGNCDSPDFVNFY